MSDFDEIVPKIFKPDLGSNVVISLMLYKAMINVPNTYKFYSCFNFVELASSQYGFPIDKLFDSVTPEILNEISTKDDFDFHTSSIIKLLGVKGSFKAAKIIMTGEMKNLLSK